MTAQRPPWAEQLDLQPHPEGGWYRRTFAASVTCQPRGYDGERPTATAIYYLLMPGEVSAWHVVRSAEIWFWHAGGPLRLRLGGAGPAPAAETTLLLGAEFAAGQQPQIVIPAGVWQSSTPQTDAPVLVSCVVSPGFDFADFRLA